MLKKGKILIELLVLFLVVDFSAELVLAFVSYKTAENNLKTEITNALYAIASRQISQFNEEIDLKTRQAENLALVPTVMESFEKPALRNDLLFYQKTFGFTGLSLLKPNGQVIYSSQRADLENKYLKDDSIHRNSEMWAVFERTNTILQTEISDFVFLEKKGLAWIATPVFKNKKFIGVLIGEIDNQDFTESCQNYTGLGQTGQTSLWVRKSDQVILMNDRRGKPNTVFWQISFEKIPTYLQKALQGEFGQGFVNNVENIENLALWSYVPALRGAIVVEIEKVEILKPIEELRWKLTLIVLVTLLAVILAAFSLARHFSQPIIKLTRFAQEVAKGNLSLRVDIKHKNEIGVLADTFNEMAANLEQKTTELADYNAHLEEKIEERTQTIKEQNNAIQTQLEELQTSTEEMQQQTEEILAQRDALQEASAQLKQSNIEINKKNQDIMDSINYARRIQKGLLPTESVFAKNFAEEFIIYKPRDVVSGDFYWVHNSSEATVVIVADCTGHGVPGALMSMIGIQILNKIVVNFGIIMPEDILQELHRDMVRIIQTKEDTHSDAMDISICTIFNEEREFLFAGAMQSLCYVQKGELYQIKGNKMPIGSSKGNAIFQTHTIKYGQEPTWIYLFTDGYADQFGGKLDRRIMSKKLKELFLEINHLQAEDQKNYLENYLENWKGKQNQIDDITVLGFQI